METDRTDVQRGAEEQRKWQYKEREREREREKETGFESKFKGNQGKRSFADREAERHRVSFVRRVLLPVIVTNLALNSQSRTKSSGNCAALKTHLLWLTISFLTIVEIPSKNGRCS